MSNTNGTNKQQAKALIRNFDLLARLESEKRDVDAIFVTFGPYGVKLAEDEIEPAGEYAISLTDVKDIPALADEMKARDVNAMFILLHSTEEEDIEESGTGPLEQLGREIKRQNTLEGRRIMFYGPEYFRRYEYSKERAQGAADPVKGALTGLKADAWDAEKTDRENEKARLSATAAGNRRGIFDAELQSQASNKAISTGFRTLDAKLDGGLYPGLYIIGAMSALGKTTFVLQIADEISASGARDVMIFSLEMSEIELYAKSISRITFSEAGRTERNGKIDAGKRKYEKQFAKSTRDILNGVVYAIRDGLEPEDLENEKRYLKDAEEKFFSRAAKTYVKEGIGDIGVREIESAVKYHTSVMGAAPVVIVDYLQILAPNDIRATDKQNTDKAVLELKRLSRDLKTPVIAISSFNRDAYDEDASMKSFKESGAIEYGCDVLVSLEQKKDTIERRDERGNEIKDKKTGKTKMDSLDVIDEYGKKITARILKNRNGVTGELEFTFDSKHNYFMDERMLDEIRKAEREDSKPGSGYSYH